MAEFLNSLDRNVVLGMAQAAAAIALCFGVVVLCRRFAVHVELEVLSSHSPTAWCRWWPSAWSQRCSCTAIC